MKHIIILGDGMADRKIASLGNKTILQYAKTPYMDLLARQGRSGMLHTIPSGFHPGSEVANMSVLGYNLHETYQGRGVLEAASIGVELEEGDMALRCNLVCIEGELLKNHSSGHIATADADVLIQYLQEKLGSERVRFYTGVHYRHVLVIKGGDARLDCTPPHDVPLHPFRPMLVKPLAEEAASSADLLNNLILKSQEILREHPLNKKRIAEGKDPANSIWPWSPGYRPNMKTLSSLYPSIKSGAVISAVDLIRGIGRYAGLRYIPVQGATGLYDTHYENKVAATLEALKHDDFVYLHIEASDEAGHEGDVALKIRTVEDLDSRVVGPIYEAVRRSAEPVAIAVLPDHPTPCEHRTHTADAVPFVICKPWIEPDGVDCYDEFSCRDGLYGLLSGAEFMNEFLSE